MTKDMTSGSPIKLLLKFIIPLIFGNLFQQFYSMVDTIIVGRYLGKEALAGVGSTGSVNYMIIGFCLGVCAGFAIPVAQRFGAKTKYAQVERADLTASPKVLHTSEGDFYARTVALATGADPRQLGLENEAALTGRGVAYCAACDGMRYKGKTVVVVGGGNSAAEDALLLSRIAEKVILVHRRDTLRATKVYHQPLMDAENVEFRWNSTVTELLHDDKLTGVKLRDVNTGEETLLPCDGLFVSVGRKPATQLAEGQLELDGSGYIVADETTKTSVPGVFAVGDVRTKPLRQVVTAVADGAMAVHMAEEYLAGGA